MDIEEVSRRHAELLGIASVRDLDEAEFGEWVDLSRRLYLWKSEQRKAEDEN